MSYTKSTFKIYVHDDCGCHRDARNFLHSWGIEASLQYDEGYHYLEFTIPQDWSQVKINRFSKELRERLKIGD